MTRTRRKHAGGLLTHQSVLIQLKLGCAVVRMVRMQQPQAPRAEQRLPRTVRAAHTRRGYSCYIYGMQTSGADRAGEDVGYRVVGGVSCVEVDGVSSGRLSQETRGGRQDWPTPQVRRGQQPVGGYANPRRDEGKEV